MKNLFLGLLAIVMFSVSSFANNKVNVKTEKSVRVLCHLTVWSHIGNQHFEDHYYFYTDTAATCAATATAIMGG